MCPMYNWFQIRKNIITLIFIDRNRFKHQMILNTNPQRMPLNNPYHLPPIKHLKLQPLQSITFYQINNITYSGLVHGNLLNF